MVAMARYEYRCTTCDERFEVWRPMSEADAATECSAGHPAKRLLSVFASVGAAGPAPSSAPMSMPSGGGCCGGGCGCG